MAEALATGRLQRLRPSMPAAGDLVNRARMHLSSAGLIADNDPSLAMSACHDAARQAISAHMRATGYRATAEAGAHRLVIEYASSACSGRLFWPAGRLGRRAQHRRSDRSQALSGACWHASRLIALAAGM